MVRRWPRPPRFALRLLHSSSTWGPPPSSRLRRSSRGRISPPAGTSRSKFWRIRSPYHYRSHHSTASRSGDPIDSVVQSTFSRRIRTSNVVPCSTPRITQSARLSSDRARSSTTARSNREGISPKLLSVSLKITWSHENLALRKTWKAVSPRQDLEVSKSSSRDAIAIRLACSSNVSVRKSTIIEIVRDEKIKSTTWRRPSLDYLQWECYDTTSLIIPCGLGFWKLSKWRLTVAIKSANWMWIS